MIIDSSFMINTHLPQCHSERHLHRTALGAVQVSEESLRLSQRPFVAPLSVKKSLKDTKTQSRQASAARTPPRANQNVYQDSLDEDVVNLRVSEQDAHFVSALHNVSGVFKNQIIGLARRVKPGMSMAHQQ